MNALSDLTVANGEGKQTKLDEGESSNKTRRPSLKSNSREDKKEKLKDTNNNATVKSLKTSEKQNKIAKMKEVKTPKKVKMTAKAGKGKTKIVKNLDSDETIGMLVEEISNVQQIVVGPSLHDGITVEVDTHEFDMEMSEEDGNEVFDEESGDDEIEHIVSTIDEDKEGQIQDNQQLSIIEQVKAFEQGKNSDAEFQKLLENKTLKRVFNQFYNDRLEGVEKTQTNNGKVFEVRKSNNCSMQVLYSFNFGRSLLSVFLGQGDLSQLIAVVNGTNDGSTVRPFVLGFGR